MDKLIIANVIAFLGIIFVTEVSDRTHEKDCQWASTMAREYQDFPMAEWEKSLVDSCK